MANKPFGLPGISIHFTSLTGASCTATCVACPVETSNILAALSAPPEATLVPSFDHWTESAGPVFLARKKREI